MTVCSRESISVIVTSLQRCAICRGSDWRRKSRLPYFCVFSSLGKNPSCRSAASSRWLATSFCYSSILAQSQTVRTSRTYFFQCHAILDQKCYSRIKIPNIFFEYEILFRLTGDLGFIVALDLLGFSIRQRNADWIVASFLPLAKSSSISRSFSFADMDRYNAVEYLFDCRAERPSLEETVFWRDIGIWDEDEDVEARERCGMTAIDILPLILKVKLAIEGRSQGCHPVSVDRFDCIRIGTRFQNSIGASGMISERKLSPVMALVGCLPPARFRWQRGNDSDLQSSRPGTQGVDGLRNALPRKPW